MDLDLSQGVLYRRHALRRLAQPGITQAQVARALSIYRTSYPARPLPRTAERSYIYEADIDGRALRVHVLEGSTPPVVLTAGWKDDEL